MHINYFFDKLNRSNALMEYANKKFCKLANFDLGECNMVFTQHGNDFIASIRCGNRYFHQKSPDAYAAIDLLENKVFRRYSDAKVKY